MKLVIMKQKCLDMLKENLGIVYGYYYSESTNEWMRKLCGEDPFVKFGHEIPEFELASFGDKRPGGEIDLENCKIIYSNLMFLTESQASDERLWAGLTNNTFYDYMRKRWGYDKKSPPEKEKGANEIKSRYYFLGGTRAGFYRNTLAKCWWVGKALYDSTRQNRFEKLDTLGASNISTKISDIFYSNTFSSNPEILDGIIDAIDYFNKSDYPFYFQNHFRPALQHLNAVGGGIILDCLGKEEISEILIQYVEGQMQGDSSDAEYQRVIEDNVEETEDLADEASIATNTVYLGCRIEIKDVDDGRIRKFNVALNSQGQVNIITELTLGKHLGDIIELEGKKYEIVKIS